MLTSVRSTAFAVASILILMLVTPSVRADDVVDNPRYQGWAKFNVGSSATYTGEVGQGAAKGEVERTYKLAEKADDHVVVEITTTTTTAGNIKTIPVQKMTIPAKMPKADVTELAKEEVEAAGKKYPCTVYELTNYVPKLKDSKLKAWMNDEIPGGFVKMDVKAETSSMTTTLKSFEAK